MKKCNPFARLRDDEFERSGEWNHRLNYNRQVLTDGEMVRQGTSNWLPNVNLIANLWEILNSDNNPPYQVIEYSWRMIKPLGTID